MDELDDQQKGTLKKRLAKALRNKYFEKPPKDQAAAEETVEDGTKKQRTPRYNNFLVDVQDLAYGYD
jgi:hypothetical protein